MPMGVSIGSLFGQVEIEDQFSEGLNKMREGMKSAIENVDKMAEHMGATGKEASEFSKGLVLAGETGAAAFAVIGIAIGVVTAGIIELGKQGSEVNDVDEAFKRLTSTINVGAVEALANLREGTAGTISDFDLMKASNKAIGAGLQLTAEQFKTVGQAAHILADQGAIPLADAFDTVMNAMTTGRARSLQMMGATTELKGATADLKAQLLETGGATSTQIDLQTKQKAIMEMLTDTVEAHGAVEKDFQDKMAGVSVTVKNFVEELEGVIAKSPVLDAAFESISAEFERAFGSDKGAMIQTLVGFMDQFLLSVIEVGKGTIVTVGAMNQAFGLLKAVLVDILGALTLPLQLMPSYHSWLLKMHDGGIAAAEGTDAFHGALSGSYDALGRISTALQKAVANQEVMRNQQGLLDRALDSKSIDGVRVAIMEMGNSGNLTTSVMKDMAIKLKDLQRGGTELTPELQRIVDLYGAKARAVSAAVKVDADQVKAMKAITDSLVPLTLSQQALVSGLHLMGVSEADIAKAYKLSEVSVKNYTTAEEAHTKGVKEMDDFTRKYAFDTLKKLTDEQDKAAARGAADTLLMVKQWKDFNDKVSDSTLRGTDLRIAQIDREWQTQYDAIRGAGPVYDDLREKLAQFYSNQEYLAKHATEALRTDYEILKKSNYATVQEVQAAWDAWYQHDLAERHPLLLQWLSDLDKLSSSFTQLAQVAGGSFGSIVKAIATVIVAMKMAGEGSLSMKKGITEIGDGHLKAGVTDLAAGFIGAATAIASATAAGTTLQRTLSGAASGAMAGSAFGPWGLAIGAIVGGLVGFVRGHAAATQAAKDLAAAVKDEGSKIIDLTRNANIAHVSMAAVFNAKTADDYKKALADVQAQIDAFHQKMDAVPGMLTELFTAVTDSGHLASQSVLDVIDKVKGLGGAAGESVTAFYAAQSKLIGGGLNALARGTIGAWNDAAKALATADDQAQSLRDDQEKLKLQIDELSKKDHLTPLQQHQLEVWRNQLIGLQQQIANLDALQKQAGQTFDAAALSGQSAFDRMGRLATVAFQSALSGGQTFLQALTTIGPALGELAAAQQQFGFKSSATLAELMKFKEFADVNVDLVAAIDGANQMMVGLHNTGMLTEETFADLTGTVEDLFKRMVDGGLTGTQALQLMQPSLQTIWELQQDFGYAVDAATQLMLDQASAAGLVGDAHRSADDKIATALSHLIDILTEFIQYLKDAATAADAIKNNIASIPDKTVTVTTRYEDSGQPNYATPDNAANLDPRYLPGGQYWTDSSNDPNAMAAGGSGTVTQPTLFLAGEAGTEQYAFSGAGRVFSGNGLQNSGSSNDEVVAAVAGVRDLLERQPLQYAVALKDALVLLPRR